MTSGIAKCVILLCFSLFPLCTYAELILPRLFTDGAVLQRSQPISIWGWAEPSSEIQIQFAKHTSTVKSDSSGFWQTELPATEAGGPYVLSVSSGSERKTVKDILLGDVWVCSGQSNMEWLLRDADNADEVIAEATDARIRHFKVPRSWSPSPESKLAGGQWRVSSPETAGEFTAVGYFFAKSIREKVDVPIGLLHSSWGGSNIESWMPAEALDMTAQEAMQNINASVAKERAVQQKVLSRLNQWPGVVVGELSQARTQANAEWQKNAGDASEWARIQVPGLWETQGYSGMDGVAWYRKQFELTDQQAAQDAVLNLARIDDADQVWLNGVSVGRTEVYNELRRYPIKSGWLKPGVNTLAVRVLDTGVGGGIYSSAALSLEFDEQQLSLAGEWFFRPEKVLVTLAGNKNHTPTALYNKMMHPLFSYPVKGLLWYQGESNAGNVQQATTYRDQFPRLIAHLRSAWQKPALPFYWVQLANYDSGGDSDAGSPWALLRESQSKTLRLPHTGQAVIIDVGDAADIHPTDKQTVGRRLAAIALNQDYEFKGLPYKGPEFVSFVNKGQSMVLTMRSDSALMVSDGKTLKGFEIAGADGIYHPAQATLQSNKITLRSDLVRNPSAVRYAWSDNPEEANLANADGFPASPFRSF